MSVTLINGWMITEVPLFLPLPFAWKMTSYVRWFFTDLPFIWGAPNRLAKCPVYAVLSLGYCTTKTGCPSLKRIGSWSRWRISPYHLINTVPLPLWRSRVGHPDGVSWQNRPCNWKALPQGNLERALKSWLDVKLAHETKTLFTSIKIICCLHQGS